MSPLSHARRPLGIRPATTAADLARRLCTVGAVLLLLSPSAPAAGPGWTANSTVTKLVVTADGGVNVRLSPDLSGCVSNSGYGSIYASIYPSHPGINRLKADLLTAYLTGGTVALHLLDATCRVNELILGGW
jgi:hypothetical protein